MENIVKTIFDVHKRPFEILETEWDNGKKHLMYNPDEGDGQILHFIVSKDSYENDLKEMKEAIKYRKENDKWPNKYGRN